MTEVFRNFIHPVIPSHFNDPASLALAPETLGGAGFDAKFEQLVAAIADQEDVRLPGGRRLAARARTEAEGVTIRKALHERLLGYCAA